MSALTPIGRLISIEEKIEDAFEEARENLQYSLHPGKDQKETGQDRMQIRVLAHLEGARREIEAFKTALAVEIRGGYGDLPRKVGGE